MERKDYGRPPDRKHWTVSIDMDTIHFCKVLAAENMLTIGEVLDSLVDREYAASMRPGRDLIDR